MTYTNITDEEFSAIRAGLCEKHPGVWLHHYGPAVEAAVLARIKSSQAPKLETGERLYEYVTGWLSAPLQCVVEFSPREVGERERGTGLKLSPDYPAEAILSSAWLDGVNVYNLLSDELIDRIEAAAAFALDAE